LDGDAAVVVRELGEGTTAMAMVARLGCERARVRMGESSSYASLYSLYWPDQTGRTRLRKGDL